MLLVAPSGPLGRPLVLLADSLDMGRSPFGPAGAGRSHPRPVIGFIQLIALVAGRYDEQGALAGDVWCDDVVAPFVDHVWRVLRLGRSHEAALDEAVVVEVLQDGHLEVAVLCLTLAPDGRGDEDELAVALVLIPLPGVCVVRHGLVSFRDER